MAATFEVVEVIGGVEVAGGVEVTGGLDVGGVAVVGWPGVVDAGRDMPAVVLVSDGLPADGAWARHSFMSAMYLA